MRQRLRRRAIQYCDNGLQQVELQYFATKKIGIGRGSVAATTAAGGLFTCRNDGTAVILDFRPRINNHCNRKHHSGHFRAAIPDFGPRLANRCSKEVKTGAIRASILDFRLRLGNRCSAEVKTGAIRAAILDFRPRLANRCSQKVKTRAIRASILDFRPRLANRCIRVAHSWEQPHPPQADSAAGTLVSRHNKKSPDSSLNRDSRSAAATYSPTWCSSTIGASELNFSVRDGKRWILTAITAAI